ncbi:ABC transporter substrate-binding protein [Verticiella sediminum]|nr:ABC transporter substrate-binding protein [Verticiella sediminum]
MAGRSVTLPRLPGRIVLLEARDILCMAMLHPDPASLVVGWAAVDRIDSPQVQASFERGGPMPVVGQQTPETLSVEGILALSPDLVVASSYMVPQGSDALLARLSALGIPVVFSEVASNAVPSAPVGPVENLHRQVRMWGDVLGAREQATAFSAFADAHLAEVAKRLKGAAPVTTYLEVQSTLDDCCWVAGTQVWGELLTLAGGTTLPAVTAPWFQKLQLEYLVRTPHDVYIASGGGWSAGRRPAIGPGIPAAEGRDGLERLVARTGFASLPSVRRHRVHGIWTGLITSPPFNVLFVEIAAKWLHPERLRDLDPAATLAELNRRFLAVPIEGPLWVSIQE